MKVLIYEPGTDGHRAIYRKYIVESFTEAGCSPVVITESFAGRPIGLTTLAKKEGVGLIFVCTMDGLYNWLVAVAAAATVRGIKVAGIYYLFNNVYEGWRSICWKVLLGTRLLDRMFTPDLLLAERSLGLAGGRVRFIPDPWDRRILRAVPREALSLETHLPGPESCVFLLFGEISPRKGFHVILEALKSWDFGARPAIKILVAGRLSSEVAASVAAFESQFPDRKSVLQFESRWIEEADHGKFFSAASFLCAIYSVQFKVSISTVLRAFAVGRPAIVGQHGMIGGLVKGNGCGYVCDVSSVDSVRAALEAAYDVYHAGDGRYAKIAELGRPAADRHEISNLKKVITTYFQDLAAAGTGGAVH